MPTVPVRRVAMLVLLVGSVALVGCADAIDRVNETRDAVVPGDDADEGDPAQEDQLGMSAMEAHEAARDRARAWHDDAQLTRVSTVEMGSTDRMAVMMANATADADMLEPDPKVGDGRAPQWALQYATPERDRAIELVVTSDGEVAKIDETREIDGDRPIDDRWQVDSDEAFATALEDPDVQRFVVEQPGRISLSLVFFDEPGHNWQMFFLETRDRSAQEDDPGFGTVNVNATTGERVPGAIRKVEPERFEHTGNLTAQEATETFPVDAARDDALVDARLSWRTDDGNATPHLNLSLLDADGRVVTADDRASSEGRLSISSGEVEAGEYTLQVSLVEGAPADAPVRFDLEGHLAVPSDR